jgi:hypothetical protein
MGAILTTGSTITCPHSPGAVAVSGDSALTVNHQAVVPQAQVASASISGCPNNSSNTAACKTVVPPVGGASVVLTVNKQAVMTESLTAATDGVPVGSTLSASAKQSVFTAS